MLSLPMFAFMPRSVQRGFVGLGLSAKKSSGLGGAGMTSSKGMGVHPYTILAFNLISQLICVSGVNQLSSVRFLFLGFFSNPSYPRAAPFCLPHLSSITLSLPAIIPVPVWDARYACHQKYRSQSSQRFFITCPRLSACDVDRLTIHFSQSRCRERPRYQRKSYSRHERQSACVSACGGSVVAGTCSSLVVP
jgi:hypothetical protein